MQSSVEVCNRSESRENEKLLSLCLKYVTHFLVIFLYKKK